jgi:hypothetical protein
VEGLLFWSLRDHDALSDPSMPSIPSILSILSIEEKEECQRQ